MIMKRFFIVALWSLCLTVTTAFADEPKKSSLQERAEAANAQNDIALARSSYIRAYEEYVREGKLKQGVECGVKATALYYKENFYKEAFDLLRRIDQSIISAQPSNASALQYYVTKERMQMYMKLRKSPNALEQLNIMERQAATSGDDAVKNDLLYTKAIYYYTFGQNEKGNAVFKEMVAKLTGTKEYDKVDEVWQTLITNGRRSGNASLTAQAYSGYIVWKDSVAALKHADEIAALKQQIAQGEADIADRDSSLAARKGVIVGLSTLLIALAVVLALGAIILLRFIVLTRRQKKTIRLANENNALKASFISNISAQLSPTLQKLDAKQPEVRALQNFADHIQTLSQLETTIEEKAELEETALLPFCNSLMDQIRDKVKNNVALMVDVPQMSAMINKDYVSHIILHLLNNAAKYTPEGEHIRLEFKKRSAHKHQFLVSNTGSFIPEEKREDVFKPFLEVRDLTTGDGLGLPICRQMALKMNGDINIDPEFTRGTRFVLNLFV